tara:strand:- start:5696 stop:5821 length:126 start_codon:yes stop_codon:yes gene_type:complete
VNKGDVRVFIVVIAAIGAAGILMNALRDNEFIKMAINGYDA